MQNIINETVNLLSIFIPTNLVFFGITLFTLGMGLLVEEKKIIFFVAKRIVFPIYGLVSGIYFLFKFIPILANA